MTASRARRVLDVAAANGHRFELVTFAVLDRWRGTPVFKAFASALGLPG
jgi:hypothetical protein